MAKPDYRQSLMDSLATASLVPGSAADLIGADFAPTVELEVSFQDTAVKLGTFLRSSVAKEPPAVSFGAEESGAAPGATYLLAMTDPDAPTPDDPKFAFWRHWIVSGLRPGAAVQTGEALTKYLGPAPKDDSRPHRYLFLLYREPEGLTLSKEDVGGEEFVERRSWKPAEFATKFGLELVGMNWATIAADGWVGA